MFQIFWLPWAGECASFFSFFSLNHFSPLELRAVAAWLQAMGFPILANAPLKRHFLYLLGCFLELS
jgi:hypothetical protein